ncbi:hypothetical protein [Undibacterium sp. TC9W]|uniref:hypothetical protein n=1 Tax=Undibacterium sp. TC9W TaxID=3413053 RepID=UPI003BF162A0
MRLNKLYVLFCLTLISLFSGCANGGLNRAQMYPGDMISDAKSVSIMNGVSSYHGEEIVGMLVGVDGKLCPGPTTNSPGLPSNVCGNNTLVLPGIHTFKAVIQATNKITFSGGSINNSWKRSEPFSIESPALEAGTIYKAIPIISERGLSIRFEKQCVSTDHDKNWPRIIAKQPCI